MAKRTLTVERLKEIQRYIGEGLSDRQIAKALKCRRSRVGEVRELGEQAAVVLMQPTPEVDPAWADDVLWPSVLEEIGQGFEIKRIWEDRAAKVTSYVNFWRYLNRRYAWLMKKTVTLREFEAGTHCEVDWAGDTVEWRDSRGRSHQAHIFIGILCFSQLIFAVAFENETKPCWLSAHEKLYQFFGGVPRVTVPDNPRTAVKKAHLYDPDLNPAYSELAAHYGTAIVPARVRHPKDKALVENAVGLVMRLFKWMNRNRRFHSIAEINEALRDTLTRINSKAHTRLRISRRERFESLEFSRLKALPETAYEQIDWKVAKHHPDCTVAVEGAFYSAPAIYRGRELRVKLTARQVEIFYHLERIAIHHRDRSKCGNRIIDPSHLPQNSQAYLETTPQHLLSQARFLSEPLRQFIDEIFGQDTLGNLRRVQGIVRAARSEIMQFGRATAEARIADAVAYMRRYGKVRTPMFTDRLKHLRLRRCSQDGVERDIRRKPNNPMLRGQTAGDAAPSDQQQPLLPPEIRDHGTDSNQSAPVGAKTLRYGDAV